MVVPQAAINNIMGGIESTGGVRLHNHRRKLKQRFDIVRKLGQGNYGKVQLGINKETGQEVAIKTIKKCKIETEADLIRIRREIQIMSSVRHPNIIHIYEVFENREKMVLVMEYAAGGELYDFLDQKKVLTEEEARQIFRQIATAIYYCHKHKICHRDLKLENILLDEHGNAKIADFGLSNVFTESRFLSTFCGSPLYASPEIVKGIPYHGPEVDCWSLGVLLYTLVYGAMPFDGSNFKRLVKQISTGDYFEPKNQSTASPLIAEMLNTDPSSRADITFICTHWWIDKDQNVTCLNEAEELANQTPVRLDLLLSLAPSPSSEKIVVGAEGVPGTRDSNRPLRSQSLGNIPPIIEKLSEIETPSKEETQQSDSPAITGVKRIEKSSSNIHKAEIVRSGSRARKKEEDHAETPAKPQVKTGNTLEEPQGVVQEPKTPTAEISRPPCSESRVEEIHPDEMALETLTPNTSDPLVCEPLTPRPGDVNLTQIISIMPEEKKERRRSSVLETVEKFNKQPTAPPKKVIIPGTKVTGGAPAKKVYERKASTGVAILVPNASRKSLSEIPVQRKPDAPFQRKVEPSPSSPGNFCLASTVNVNLLAEKALSSPEVDSEVGQPPVLLNKAGEIEDNKVKNAVSVIGKALSESSDNLDKKFSSLPRKPKADSTQPTPIIVPINKPSGEFRSEIRHMVNSPPTVTQRTEVTFPVAAAPAKTVIRQGNQSREHIIPIKLEQDVVPQASQSPTPARSILKSSSQQSQQNASRTSSRSLSRQSTGDSDSSICSSGDPIRKSAREVIIPIAVEGGGYITPSSSALNRINSITESEDDASASGNNAPRCFTLRSTRRRIPSQTSTTNNKSSVLETADSVSSDEDDDNFEILTAENLFSTLLSRVRSLTQRLNTDENRSAYPRSIFHHGSIFDNPGSRLSETRSFSRADGIHPWRRSLSREPRSGSSSTLPRDRSKSSNRNILNLSQTSNRDERSPYRSRLRPPVTIKNSLSKQLMKERLDELDGIDKPNEIKTHSGTCNGSNNSNDYPVVSMTKSNHSEPYVYKMRTRQRTNTIEPDVEHVKPGMYHMRTRSRCNSSELVNETLEQSLLKIKRPISIHESMDNNSPVAKRIYQRSFSCDRNKVNAILRDSAKILKSNYNEPIPPAVQSFKRTNSLRQPDNSKNKEYRRSLSTNTTGYGESSVLERNYPSSNSPLSPSERMFSPTRKISRFLSSSMYEPVEHTSIRDVNGGKKSFSRIKNTIKSLSESGVGPESSIDSESNLIKRAISSESKKLFVESSSNIYRANSSKQNSTSNKNVYKDLISKIVNSRDSSVNKSILNDKKNLGLKNDPVEENNKSVNERDSTEKSRFLGCSTNEKSADLVSRIKLTPRLNSNSEPILLRNRRYSIPRPHDTHNVNSKNVIDFDKNLYKYNDGSITVAAKKVPESNGHLSENEVEDQLEDVAKGNNNITYDTKNVDESLEKVEKVINNWEKSNEKDVSDSISKLKRLDLSQIHSHEKKKYERASSVAKSLDHFENSSRRSVRSPTEESDAWSVGSDCPSPSSTNEETISERVRRKSFFSRFNPMKNTGREKVSPPSRLSLYARSSSADNPNSSQHGLTRQSISYRKSRES